MAESGGKSYILITIIAWYYNIRCSKNQFYFYKHLLWVFYAYYTVIIILQLYLRSNQMCPAADRLNSHSFPHPRFGWNSVKTKVTRCRDGHCDLRAFRHFGDSQPFLAGPSISRKWKIIDCSHFPPFPPFPRFRYDPFLFGKNAQLKPQMRTHIFVYHYFHVYTIYLTRLGSLVYFETFQCLQSTDASSWRI
jgi:hypothetical protein